MNLDHRAQALPAWLKAVLMAVLGVITALGLPPNSWWFVACLGLAPMFGLFPQAQTARQAGFWLWLFGLGYFIVALRWLVEPFQVEAEIFGWMAPFALIFMAMGLALFWWLAGWAAARLCATKRGRAFALVVTLSFAELARAYVLTGFPWAGFAQILVDTRAAHLLAGFGPHGLAALFLCLNAASCLVVPRRALTLAFVPLLVTVQLMATSPHAPDPDTTGRPILRIVQPNAPQHEKWDPEHAATYFWRQVDATAAEPRPDLILWPETAIPQLYNNADETLKVVAEAAAGVPVIFGMQRYDAAGYYNALLVMDETGQVTQIYDKHHLVPFGEYMPLASVVGKLGIKGLAQQAAGGYASGPGPRLLDLGARLGSALPLICYEAVFPQHASSPEGRPDFLIQITNDAWFGADAGPQQHLAQARMRAIEQGLPMARSANTGISAMIDANGHITASLEMGTHGYVDAPLPVARQATVYAKTGDWPVAFLLALAFAALIIRRFIKING